ncbi:asparaginase [Paenibacillus melissococcoides]|uniref:Asparaginase n=1 Tax=Paenibacillus melissococcoides TaxID=2912268 RepID=A0ABM9G297_9BACL|nr:MULTISPECIES: asparaginase [Paenibacillus]MEB9895143.1 asparaginase [Bacillus cereus]CAH8245717.1 asparaginase [Paenibacillus melissococcoides]CAH8249840.1 asparaginase [Paenibacillus melissococcoides]CAH8711875.1 asparaginase [Paenibacillus melissococcoides]CAH8712620.1 asparaginase [Paenibacillus melissococcoides]
MVRWEAAYKQVYEENKMRREEELERFFMLFNIFCHEVRHVSPDLFEAVLELEELMNETF